MSEYRVIDLSAWTQVGQGGNGTTYENPSQPDLILKVDRKQINTLEFVKHEFDVSKARWYVWVTCTQPYRTA